MPALSAHALRLPRSGIREVMDLAWAMDGPVIGLHVGEPSFATPEHVLDGARQALAAGHTRYVSNAGIPALRAALASKLERVNGLPARPEQVVVTNGGMEALFVSLAAVLSEGDEVLLPDPGWPGFDNAVRVLRGRVVSYALEPGRGFLPDLGALERSITPRTRALLVNSPSNPLGAMLPAELAEALVRFASSHDLWLISDECYDQITFEAEHVSPARFDEQGRVLSCFSFSKTYAMTGMRVGYVHAPDAAAGVIATLQEPVIACVNAPAQHAALAALEGPQDIVPTMRDAYRSRRDRAATTLDEAGLAYLLPQGAFYLWIDVSPLCGGDVKAWALELLREQRVAVAPGTAFGPRGEGWIRVSLATETDELLEGLDRIARSGVKVT
jgi:aspartate aminotransferase